VFVLHSPTLWSLRAQPVAFKGPLTYNQILTLTPQSGHCFVPSRCLVRSDIEPCRPSFLLMCCPEACCLVPADCKNVPGHAGAKRSQKVVHASVNLGFMLQHPIGLKCLALFHRKEHSEENIKASDRVCLPS
jgi:hypothetical protein